MKRDELTKHNDTMRGWYFADEADAVMDEMEARIKELEQTHNLEECPLRNENRELKKRLEELEAKLPKADK